MDFDDAARRFGLASSGSDAFKTLSREMLSLMKSDPSNAAFYFVIGIAARSYVQRYEDQGVSGAFADSSHAALVALCARVSATLRAPPEQRLRTISELVVDYEFGITAF